MDSTMRAFDGAKNHDLLSRRLNEVHLASFVIKPHIMVIVIVIAVEQD